MLDQSDLQKIVQEINEEAEKNRRALSLRRYEIYRDGGKRFLVEQIMREFGQDSLKEMRIAPLNLLKKIVNKRASLYRKPAIRRCEAESDQILVDYYVEQWGLDVLMQKANRYYILDANTCLYMIPKAGEMPQLKVMPAYLYSAKINELDVTKADAIIFSAFTEAGQAAPMKDGGSPTGQSSFDRNQGYKSSDQDLVASNEIETNLTMREYIVWSDEEHYTLDHAGQIKTLAPEAGPEQFVNPVGLMPIVSIQKDRDIQYWATQGEDLVELALTLQLGWSDLLTIAKHQGFSIMTIASEAEPAKQEIGINKAIWLKLKEGSPTPSVDFVQASSPISEYKQMLMDLMALMLSTNDMNAKELVGAMNGSSINSAAQAIVEMADTIEAREEDKPVFRTAEKDLWLRVAAWHNWLYDANQLPDELRALGKFSPDFEVSIHYSDIKPVESEQERINTVKSLRDMGLITRFQAMKKLYPDLTDEQIQQSIEEIDEESKARAATFGLQSDGSQVAGEMDEEEAEGEGEEDEQAESDDQVEDEDGEQEG